jgi:nitroimidazol reductase NimA-like FMN-containing flavoprotein (pyridoxamine 5'-phosphate oxidase superfamily)
MPYTEPHSSLVELTAGECLHLLAGTCIGRVGFVAHGVPHILPVNYASDDDGAVAFRTSPQSVLATIAGQVAVFEVDGYDETHKLGWSVCVLGLAREITGDEDAMARRLHALDVVPWAPGQRDRWFAITADDVTGRRIPLQASPRDLGWQPGVLG